MPPLLTILNENNHSFLRLVSPYCVLEMKNSLPCVQYSICNWKGEEITDDISNTLSPLPLSSCPAYSKSTVNLTMGREGWLDLLMGPLKKKTTGIFHPAYHWFRSVTLIYGSRWSYLRLSLTLYQIINYSQFNWWGIGSLAFFWYFASFTWGGGSKDHRMWILGLIFVP